LNAPTWKKTNSYEFGLSEPYIFLQAVNMPSKDFKCKLCGNCCINLGDAFSTCATEKDIYLWEEEGRDDILEWVGFIPLGDEYV